MESRQGQSAGSNGLYEKLSTIRQLESEVQNMTADIISELERMVGNQVLSGVAVISGQDGVGPHIAIVRSSLLFDGPETNWSPEYYLPIVQAEAVRSRLDSCRTIQQVCMAVAKMITERKVAFGNGKVFLNKETLRILRDSEIGRFAIEENTSPTKA